MKCVFNYQKHKELELELNRGEKCNNKKYLIILKEVRKGEITSNKEHIGLVEN